MSSSSRDQFKPEHPRHDDANTGPSGQPEKIPYPGMTEEMQQKPDHGDKTYRGTGTCCSNGAAARHVTTYAQHSPQ
jgi:hypothetical protein